MPDAPEPPEPEQSTAWVDPLESSENVEDFLDADGQIKGSPANDVSDEEDA